MPGECRQTAFTWVLKAPDATLFDGYAQMLAKHFAGPTWMFKDGSRIVAEKLKEAPAANPKSIPWLLLKVSQSGSGGPYSRTAFIQRVNTAGGSLPKAAAVHPPPAPKPASTTRPCIISGVNPSSVRATRTGAHASEPPTVKLKLRHNFTRFAGLAAFLLTASPLVMGQGTTNQAVRFHTNLGDIDVALLNTAAPNTVANFLMYVSQGSYNNSVIHRSVPGFIFQGGGFQLQNGSLVAIPQGSPVVNEFSVSNTRGTLAMAKLGSDPNSATNQWFFNEGNNAANLDNQNGGFTVFGRIISAAGLAVMDQIAAVPVPSPGPLPSPFDQIPLINYDSGTVQPANFVTVLSVTQLSDIGAPTIADNGVVTASNFGGYASAAPGSYIEIYGSNLGGDARGWASTDFVNGNAPTSLGGVTVTVNGRSAYVNYVSPTQINVEIPGVTPTGGSVPVVVTYLGQSSASFMLPIQQNAAGGCWPRLLQRQRQAVRRQYCTTPPAPWSATAPFPGSPTRPLSLARL